MVQLGQLGRGLLVREGFKILFFGIRHSLSSIISLLVVPINLLNYNSRIICTKTDPNMIL